MHDHVHVRHRHLFLNPLHRELGIKVVAVLVADREVPFVLPRRNRNAYDVPIFSSPTGTKGLDVGVLGLKVHGNVLIPR